MGDLSQSGTRNAQKVASVGPSEHCLHQHKTLLVVVDLGLTADRLLWSFTAGKLNQTFIFKSCVCVGGSVSVCESRLCVCASVIV